jgi:hypothetical protein
MWPRHETMGDPSWHADMLKSQVTMTDTNQLIYNGLKTSKKCGQDMTIGDPNWHAYMLKTQVTMIDKLSFKRLL